MYILYSIAALSALAIVGAVVWLWLSPYPMDMPLSLLTLLKFLFALKATTRKVQRQPWNIHNIWDSRVASSPSSPFITNVSTKTTFTYKSADNLSRNVSSAVQSLGGCTSLALVMPSCAEYVCLWLGLSRVGVKAALINTNLMGAALVHAIKTAVGESECKRVVVSEVYRDRVFAVKEKLEALGVEILVYNHVTKGAGGGSADMPTFDSLLASTASKPIDEAAIPPRAWDADLFYIYTSGTTGLPKASKINHLRFYIAGLMFSTMTGCTSSDRVYCALPLYHSAGGMLGVSGCICAGSEMVLREKFSVSGLSRDLVDYKITVLQYIGEFARFAVNGSKTPELDAQAGKTCRVALGNGMRPEVWRRFQDRFKIPKIVEFYGSTEGNATLCNNCNVPGAIGVIPWFAKFLYPVRLALCDPDEGTLLRGPDGLAMLSPPDTPGHLLGLIKDNDPTRRFDGYTDAAATKKKIATNVLRKGDKWFASGDLLRSDSFGFLYWVDRIGDTFRWKGENVSTAEVAAAFISDSGTRSAIDDANVYGVTVPGQDGRAGMARLTLKVGLGPSALNLKELYGELAAELPVYARPLFLRVPRESAGELKEGEEMTGTFKHKKGPLRDAGYDLEKVGDADAVYFRDDSKKEYVVITPGLQKELDNCKKRV
mmetsp:Transcript_16179/g.32256  ORF Transcript_16179/g.32256 Transcript_16179/m.32256 type:complete len:656 (+) Transcript_16179:22-1989(+)